MALKIVVRFLQYYNDLTEKNIEHCKPFEQDCTVHWLVFCNYKVSRGCYNNSAI